MEPQAEFVEAGRSGVTYRVHLHAVYDREEVVTAPAVVGYRAIAFLRKIWQLAAIVHDG